MLKGISKTQKMQNSRRLEDTCWRFTQPLLEQMDRRLVKTFFDLVLVILIHRHRNNGLLLSELGKQLLGGERGTGRGEADREVVAFS